MGEFGTIDGQAGVPMDTDALQEMLQSGPDKVETEARPSPPPRPTPRPQRFEDRDSGRRNQEALEVEDSSSSEEEERELTPEERAMLEMREFRKHLRLPPPALQDQLKQKYGELRVVPNPTPSPDKLHDTYLMRVITRAKWRAMEEAAAKIVQSKPGRSYEEILEEKIVAQAVVWPSFPEQEMAWLPAGLVTTLFGIARQMACFFEPTALMDLTYIL